jgi:5-formyltetrahydrofolate cyclo-ligase
MKVKGAVQDMDKEKLRMDLRKRLQKITAAERAEKSRRACENLIETPEFQNACTVMMYMSLPHELDICEAILKAWQTGKTVAVPKISWEQRHMIPVEITSLETGFSTEVLGLRNPVNGRPVPFEDIDLVVTPALGYDRKGNRLGRGGSYYDRFLANERLKAVRCGMGFEEQVVEQIPVTEHDEPIDFLVTDKEVIYFKIRQGG